MKLILSLLLLTGFASSAGDPAGFHFWSAAELKGTGQELAAKAKGAEPATRQLATVGNYGFIAIERKATGQAELHEKQADIMVVERGEGTLVYGGKMVGGKTTAAGEIRGSGIEGGMEKRLAPGDIATIPINTPHQVKLAPGQEIYYVTVKVTP
jgi:mannose-6-phosphate isomerase-like protein (cupin superfamily)